MEISDISITLLMFSRISRYKRDGGPQLPERKQNYHWYSCSWMEATVGISLGLVPHL